jgi:DNA-binding PadR family transcriptional regulator
MSHHYSRPSSFGGRGRQGHFGGRGGFFARFGSEFMGGPGIRAAKMFASDDLQLIILALLSEKPRHGYEIIKALEEHSSGVYVPSPGMVYPALTYLAEMGYATSETTGNKKLYRITESGQEQLSKNRAVADEALENLARFGARMAQFREQFVEEEAVDEKWGGGSRERSKREWRQMKTEFHELKHELKAALFEKLQAPLEEKKRILAVLQRAIAEIRGT